MSTYKVEILGLNVPIIWFIQRARLTVEGSPSPTFLLLLRTALYGQVLFQWK